jgi:hypothetical protein
MRCSYVAVFSLLVACGSSSEESPPDHAGAIVEAGTGGAIGAGGDAAADASRADATRADGGAGGAPANGDAALKDASPGAGGKDAEPTETGAGGGGGISVILDTDMGPDIDDAGALAVLHALADNGEARLLGVVISTSNGGGTAAIGFIDQVNTYYGRPDIPIGAWKGGSFHGPDASNYTRVVYEASTTFPRSLDDQNDSVPDTTSLYRTLLAAAPDGSVTVACTGFLNNLKALLDSGPDGASPLAGPALVAKKVKQLVQMGGQYPSGFEYNFFNQTASGVTRAVVEGWPTPIVFSGWEIGDPIHTGSALAGTSAQNPVRRAYEVYFGGGAGSRSSWDLTAVLYAVRGASSYWDLLAIGHNDVTDDGHNTWVASPDLDQSYLEAKATTAAIETVLSDLMTKPPGVSR